VTLEDGNKKVLENKDAVKKMNSSNAKALNTMKQKLRKYNKLFEKDIETFRATPTAESGSEDEKKEEKKKAEPAKKAGASKYAKGAAGSDESSESESEVRHCANFVPPSIADSFP
jgi:translation initiation factor 3 subunit C